MSDQTRRRVLAALGGTVAVGLAGCSGGGNGTATDAATTTEGGMTEGESTDTEMSEMTTTEGEMTEGGMDDGEQAMVRVSHMSPDAPNVDVYVDGGDPVLSDVPFGTTSDYLPLPGGTYTVTITAAGDADTVAFEGDVSVEAGTSYTVAAIGELTSEDSEFRPLVLEDDVSDPGGDSARVRVVHASPDAPAVDVTVAASGDAIVDGAAFGDTASVTVPANDYTLEIRGDTESNDGDVVADYDVSLNGGTVYTAFAAGYLSPDDEPTDEAFDLLVEQDASY
ncbi:DUF4397 domain-containing protein [Halorientalis marina]|uniref:DUF4397 domain-containing protein n=1 Tax=Halorientalis marina TaxID=2931976 RepID=UPI001FF3AF41|nr:DUF4397 domain-containing protein [Halorientalis marina]